MKFTCNIKIKFSAKNIAEAKDKLKQIANDILTETQVEEIEITDDERFFEKSDL